MAEYYFKQALLLSYIPDRVVCRILLGEKLQRLTDDIQTVELHKMSVKMKEKKRYYFDTGAEVAQSV
jgi:hypothetical protein